MSRTVRWALVACSLVGCGSEPAAGACLYGSTKSAVALAGITAADQPPGLCFARPLPLNADGLVDCRLLVEFPAPGEIDAGVGHLPTRCDQLAGLTDTGRETEDAAPICEVTQLPARDGRPPGGDDGWIYSENADASRALCGLGFATLLFTQRVRVPNGSRLRLACGFAVAEDGEVLGATSERCATPAPSARSGAELSRQVGETCDPGVSPEAFDDRDSFVMPDSPECGPGPCLAYQLAGPVDPYCRDPDLCVAESELNRRVYCSCRCAAPEGVAADADSLCSCPGGFSCIEALPGGPDTLAGSYCVRDGTFLPE